MGMRVHLLQTLAVSAGSDIRRGHALGGRRARLALAALALADGPLSADRLAEIIWGEDLPATWPVALRGVVRGLRTACSRLGRGEQLIVTTPAGYRLADGVQTDIRCAVSDLDRAESLHERGRYRSVIELADPLTRIGGDQLLPDETAQWLLTHRRAVDATALYAAQLVVDAAARMGDHHRAVRTAAHAVESQPLEECAHRELIRALDGAGDRAGAIRAYEHCRRLLAAELGIDPSAETTAVYLNALRDRAGGRAAPVPLITSSFLGRDREMAALMKAIERPGLVTVAGKGGVGKSRLVVHVAARCPQFEGGRLWIPLGSVDQDVLVAASVAMTLGVLVGTDPVTAVADRLAPQGRVLLVLDGCEATIDGVASLVTALLALAPLLTVVTTSRRPLSIAGEHIITVEPWPVPGPALEASGQLRLLTDRVREAGGDLRVDPGSIGDLSALCRRCGGIPLALELAAGQLAVLPTGMLVDHLAETVPSRDGLRAITAGSYALLAPDEAAVFRRIAVLAGPVTLPTIRRVVSDESIPPTRVVRIVRELTERNLLTVDRSTPHWRYQQDDDLHSFARERIEGTDEEAACYGRVADVVRTALPENARADPGAYRAQVSDLLASVRSLFTAALSDRADPDRAQELAFRLHRYFAVTNVEEGRFWLSRLIPARPAGPWSPFAIYAAGYLSYWSGQTRQAMGELERAASLLHGVEDSLRARALIFLAGLLDDVDRGGEAIAQLGLAIEAARPLDADLQCSAAMGMGSLLAERVDPDAARYAREAIENCRSSGSAEQLSIALPTAAMICWQVGALDEARDYVAEALPLNAAGMRIARVVLLSAAAGVALADGDIDAAVEFGSVAETEAVDLGVEREVPLIRAVLARGLLARNDPRAAARQASGALRAALRMSTGSPLAVGLETAALVLHAAGSGTETDLGHLLDAAATIRSRGDRPAPATLARAVSDLRVIVGPAVQVRVAVDPVQAAHEAMEHLAVVGCPVIVGVSA